MQYLGLALYAEGPTDYYFLRPLLQRLCEDICAKESPHAVEFAEVLALDDDSDLQNASREQRILGAAHEARGAWRILFVHTDGAANPAQAREHLAQPAIDLLRRDWGDTGIGVAVMPIRETESWAICDVEALRRVLGTTLSPAELGLPATPAAVESAFDPKLILKNAFLATQPSGRRKRHGIAPMLNALGEQVALRNLRALSGFMTLESELRSALRTLHILL